MLQLYSAMRTVCPLTIIIFITIVTSSALRAPPSTATTSQTAESLFASPVMVSFLPNGDMHVITHANGFQFYVLPAKAVNLPANQVTVRSGGHQSLLQQWPVLAGSRLFQEDFSQGAVVSGFEDFGGGDDQHSQRVAFLFSPWIRYRFDTLLPASAGEDGVEVFPRLAGEQGIYLVNSGAQTLYWLEDQDGGLTKVKRVEYDTDTGRFEILAVSAICRGGGGGGEQVVQLLKEPRGAPPPCARSPAEFGEASNGLTCGFATTGQFQGQGPVVETFYLFGAKSVLIFAHNQRLVVRALGEFFKVVDGGGGGGSSVSPSGKSSKLDPVTAILIVVGLSVLFAAVIILVGIIYCSCCACSSPSPSSSSSTTAAATKASSSSSGAKGSAQALPKHRQPKLSSKQSKKEKAEKEEEKEKTAMETAVETAAVESEEEASAAFEDQPQPPKAKKRSAFAGKVGFLKSTSKELVRKPKQQQKQQKQQAERASEMLPFSLTNTALSSLQTDALPVGKLSELVGQPLKQPLKQLKQKRPKQKQPKQQQQLSVTTRSRSAGKGKSRSLAKSRGKSARPKSARGGGGKTVLAGGKQQQQQPWPATATILTTAEEDEQPTVLMAPPKKGGKVGRRGSQAHFFSSDSDVSTTRRSKSKAKSNTKKSSKGKKKQKGPKTSKNATSSSAATEPVAETILTAREKVVVVVVDKSSSGGKSKSKAKGKGGGGGGSRNTSTSNSTKSSSSSDGGK